MAELKKYTSFEALKLNEKSSEADQRKAAVFSDFEAFLKSLQSEYLNNKKTKAQNEKQPG